MSRSPRLPAAQAGTTLVELLIAMTIMATMMVVIFGALSTYYAASSAERSTARLDEVVRNYAEGVVSAPYVACATSYGSVALPAGYALAAFAVRYWNGDNPATFGAVCAPDRGVEQITANVKDNASGHVQSIVLAKRATS